MMNRLSILSALTCLVFVVSGCGPMITPMPERLNEKDQLEVDESWETLLTPVEQADHQLLLDVLVGTGAFQTGVDTLYFRSEKRFSDGRIVMEVHFDREEPESDRFEVKVFDQAGNLLREETYDRPEVKQTIEDLFTGDVEDKTKKTPEMQEQLRAKREARWKRIGEAFPVAKKENAENKENVE